MNIYTKVTQQDLINLSKLAEQQENQREIKIENRVLRETRDRKLTESLAPRTKKLEVNKSTQKLGEVIKENNTLPLAIDNTHNELPIEMVEMIMHQV